MVILSLTLRLTISLTLKPDQYAMVSISLCFELLVPAISFPISCLVRTIGKLLPRLADLISILFLTPTIL